MNWHEMSDVCDLRVGENNLLQALLSKFSLYRDQNRVQLNLRLSGDLPAIRRRESKRIIRKAMPDFKAKSAELQAKLDLLILDGSLKEYPHDDPEFVFRYSNGGTLPIIELNGVDYFCLFFRDVEPIGWNIANGASDTISELLDPRITIHRELREELIILDLNSKVDYVFPWDHGIQIELPAFKLARREWSKDFPGKRIGEFSQVPLDIHWIDGPDSVQVNYGNDKKSNVGDVFVNVNALDYGIEIDRAVRIQGHDQMTLLDGEMHDQRLLGRPIGLFEVSKVEQRLLKAISHEDDAEALELLPDKLFYDGNNQPVNRLKDILWTEHIKRLEKYGLRGSGHIRRLENTEKLFKCCPVTYRIIRRYLQKSSSDSNVGHELFVSYSSEDSAFAAKLVHDLYAKGIKCWIDHRELEAGVVIGEKIEEAINSATVFLVIFSKNSIASEWVKQEFELACKLEGERDRHIIVPIMLDRAVLENTPFWVEDFRSVRQIANFTQWENTSKYRALIHRLVLAIDQIRAGK